MAINYELHTLRARKAWPILVRRVKSGNRPYTYRELTEKMCLHWRSASWFLGVIQRYCRAKRLPPLQAFAVNSITRIPGEGYNGSPRSRKAHAKAVEAVRAKNDWSLKLPPFPSCW